MKSKVFAVLFVLTASPLLAQDVVPTLRASRAAYPTPMSKAQLSEMLSRAASEHPGWGMLRKDGGNNCPTPYPGVSISCDWMVYGPTRWGYDLLSDQEGAASIVESGGESLSPGQEVVYPWTGAVTPPPVVPPVVTPPSPQPAVDLSGIERHIETTYLDLVARLMEADAKRTAEATALAAQVKAHDENPSYLAKVFTNRYVQLLLAGAGALVTREAAK